MTYRCAWRPEAKWPFHHSLPELLGKDLTETDAQPIWLHWCPEIHRDGSASGSRGLELETCITAPGFTCGSHRSKHGSSSFHSLLFISQAIYLAAGSYVAQYQYSWLWAASIQNSNERDIALCKIYYTHRIYSRLPANTIVLLRSSSATLGAFSCQLPSSPHKTLHSPKFHMKMGWNRIRRPIWFRLSLKENNLEGKTHVSPYVLFSRKFHRPIQI